MLAISGQAMFRSAAAERQGAAPGVWDLLDDHIGARNVPPYHSLPWPVVLRTGITISINADGRVRSAVGRAPVQAVEDAERVLQQHAGAAWIDEETFVQGQRAMEVVYGELGPRAIAMQRQPVFR